MRMHEIATSDFITKFLHSLVIPLSNFFAGISTWSLSTFIGVFIGIFVDIHG